MKITRSISVMIFVAILIGIVVSGCGSLTTYSTAFKTSDLTGAGATFPYPLYSKWFNIYAQQTGVQINYQAIGSGAGINQIIAGTVDFGASDAIMNSLQESQAEAASGPILQIPMTVGSVAIIYNLPGIKSLKLNLSGKVLADMYLDKITQWNDPEITALNPGLNLPDQGITLVHRSDGSGTTYIFTNYLTKVSDEWQTRIGFNTSVSWPGGIGGDQSAGVAAAVQQSPYSIGYVELSYAIENNVPYALVQNSSGNFIEPNISSTDKAAEGITYPDDMRIMITNSPNQDAYPISGFTWILAYVNQPDQAKGEALVKMLWWAVHDGQQYGAALYYGSLSSDAVTKVENEILSIKYNGQPLMTTP